MKYEVLRVRPKTRDDCSFYHSKYIEFLTHKNQIVLCISILRRIIRLSFVYTTWITVAIIYSMNKK